MEKTEEKTIEQEFARTFKLIDLYIRQKTDLFIQNYVLELFEYVERQIIILSVIVVLLAAAALSLYVGVIFLLSTIVPLWAALLITGILTLIIVAIMVYVLFTNKLILNTPTATELTGNGKA